MKTLSTLCLAISILLVTACSNLRVEETAVKDNTVKDNTELNSNALKPAKQLKKWQLRGKLGVRSQKNATSANLQWQQDPKFFSVKLSGPFGAGTITAQGNQEIIDVKQGEKTFLGSPQTISDQLLGIPLPLNALSWWARGLPSPNLSPAVDQSTDAQGRINGFKQGDWQLVYTRYMVSQGYLLPTKMSGQFGDLSFKLIVSDWNTTDD